MRESLMRLPNQEVETITLRVISLGAGVQSTALVLMAAHGEIKPMPDCAIFADTGAEPREVYEHLRWLMSANVLPFPVHVVSAGNIIDGLRMAVQGKRWAAAPFFALGNDGRAAPIRRQCTNEYKLVPIRRKVRELAGLTGRRSPRFPIVEQWIGISMDERIRMKPSRETWQVNRFPLVEKGMTRADCLLWLERNGYPKPPRSSCSFCPFHSNEMWRHIRDNQPEAWAQAVEIDALIADGLPSTETRKGTGPLALHRSMKRLPQVDLSKAGDRGQPDIFGDECEGMCGV